jgi:hypothetical protein
MGSNLTITNGLSVRVRLNRSTLISFALVDLKGFEKLLDVFLVPSKVIFDYFEQHKPIYWARYHPPIDDLAQYKNNWELLTEALDTP